MNLDYFWSSVSKGLAASSGDLGSISKKNMVGRNYKLQ